MDVLMANVTSADVCVLFSAYCMRAAFPVRTS